MKSVNPQGLIQGLPTAQMQWAKSLHETVNGGISPGQPQGKDSTGQYNQFSGDNMSGTLIRVGASGSGNGPENNWGSTGTGLPINHKLGRQPIGTHLVSSDKALTIWQTTTPNENTITIAPSDATANATIYVF